MSDNVRRPTSENVTDVVSPDHAQHLRLLEALVFAGTQALDEKELADRLPNDADVQAPAGRSRARCMPTAASIW